MKLNLGCGNDIKSGYVNVDLRKTHAEVNVVDLSVLPWPFESESADEILMLDFLEHFPYAMTKPILLECFRVLKATGTVVIQVPDARHLMRALTGEGDYLCNRCGGSMEVDVDGLGQRSNLAECYECKQSASAISDAAMRRLYGGQDYAGNFHHTCFTDFSLMDQCKDCGLELVDFEEVAHQWKNWNLKARFRKGDVW